MKTYGDASAICGSLVMFDRQTIETETDDKAFGAGSLEGGSVQYHQNQVRPKATLDMPLVVQHLLAPRRLLQGQQYRLPDPRQMPQSLRRRCHRPELLQVWA